MRSPCLDLLTLAAAIANLLVGLVGVFLLGVLLWYGWMLLAQAGPSFWLLLGIVGAAAHAARTLFRAHRGQGR
jgi:hypothetical protein